jgi:hypothetical protein
MAVRGYAHDPELNWVAGQTGSMESKKIKLFKPTKGEIAGLGARRSMARNWRIGGQA